MRPEKGQPVLVREIKVASALRLVLIMRSAHLSPKADVGQGRWESDGRRWWGGCSSAVHISVDGGARSLQKGALMRALRPSWIDPHPSYSTEAQLSQSDGVKYTSWSCLISDLSQLQDRSWKRGNSGPFLCPQPRPRPPPRARTRYTEGPREHLSFVFLPSTHGFPSFLSSRKLHLEATSEFNRD